MSAIAARVVVIVRWLDGDQVMRETIGGSSKSIAMERAWRFVDNFVDESMANPDNWALVSLGSANWLEHKDLVALTATTRSK